MSGDKLHIDYRIFLPEGQIRWICARGDRFLDAHGQPNRLMGVSLDITERMILENRLRERIEEIKYIKQRLEKENIYRRGEVEFLGEHIEVGKA